MELQEEQYQIQNVSLTELCEQYGAPLYVYDFERMEAQYNRILNAFQHTNLRIMYACKALSNVNVLKFFKKIGSGVDTVSIQEVRTALRAGFEPSDVMYTPNCVSFEEIQEAVSLGVKINIDNLSMLEHFGNYYGNSIPICIRINPHIFAGGNPKISVGHIDSKFGISIYQMRHLERILDSTGITVNGLHMHTGSDILDIDAFLRGTEVLLSTAKDYFKDLEYIDFGSGFKVPYKPTDQSTDIEDLGERLGNRFNEFCTEYGRPLTMMFEPGKFLVSEAGYFLVKTNVIKQTTATVFAGVDSGMNHLIRPMFYNAYHHIVNISHPQGTPRYYTVVGYICETDTFGWDRKINEIREGDILAFKNAGAYAFSMSSNYNSRYRPAEIGIYQGQAKLIRQRETMEDIFANQVEQDW
jgi:diaminopimelate decarboxylase